ncbi:thio(seleno)oxazole modification radical SAM maturase SbtM [Desulfoferula mesophila]|uniref:Selenobiotic family peptide radical SAM maturase n=1 Tax=Desulfoferula mesophila TaxID=3058419 RepID=A0AAU9F1G6_9BACT|nr:selenobiotic family peptide radical SAM maturase [Desulfoferula mesophilus]
MPSMSPSEPYQSDLERLRRARARAAAAEPPRPGQSLGLNPTLVVEEVAWRGLPERLAAQDAPEPQAASQPVYVGAWRAPGGEVRLAEMEQPRLLALKVAAEGLDPLETARQAGSPPTVVLDALDLAAKEGLLLRPPSLLARAAPQAGPAVSDEFLRADWFTLQWHITQACDLNCRHCYDRSDRPPVDLARGLQVLDQLAAFCAARRVRGQVSFSGGNPLLHPDFLTLYGAAVERGLGVAILGNPCGEAKLAEILDIAPPAFYQVSLEGLEPHNDYIRGRGHFLRTSAFLDLLREAGVRSMVMLTLSRDNLDQVIPLARLLRGKVDQFNFNRLAPVGSGAALAMADPDDFRRFLADYAAEAAENPVLGLKDNLLNLHYEQEGLPLFGGCTGFGCGAAFNFLALLPDGQVHACRKLPSPVGDLYQQGLGEIYDGEAARRYRRAPEACAPCRLRAVCGGCLAVAHGAGRDVSTQRDPFCWLSGPLA